MIRRISFFGGPNCSKSTLAMRLTADLKARRVEAEHCQEYVKAWSFIGTSIRGYDQFYILAKQMHREDIILRASASIVVTDSPVLLGVCYAKRNGLKIWPHLMNVGLMFEKEYPSLNFFVDRKDLPYSQIGRYEDKEQAKAMDAVIMDAMAEVGLPLKVVGYDEYDKILNLSLAALGQTK
jgi:nicotinamide riboside kinase